MTDLDDISHELGISPAWREELGSCWLAAPGLDPRALAHAMLARRARFVTITAIEQPNAELRLDYHWDLDGPLLTFTLATESHQIPSITELCPGADWVEREIHDYFAVDFLGRDLEPLMLCADDKPGFHLRNGRSQ